MKYTKKLPSKISKIIELNTCIKNLPLAKEYITSNIFNLHEHTHFPFTEIYK